MKDWALILGASSGIGRECAKRLAKNGMNIYGLYLRKRKDEISALKKELSEFGVKVIYKKANASNEGSRQEILKELKNQGDLRIKMFIHSIAFGTLKNMIGNKNLINNASLEQIITMLTYCVRGERFCDGFWASMIEDRYIKLLLERLIELNKK